ncbi:MAG: GNAT family N-acetyltransferase [Bdellovibrionales bacterium]
MSINVRPLNQQDLSILDAFLKPHTAEAYFLRSNALSGGLAYEGKFLQGEYFGAFEADQLVGVLCYSWLHTLLVFVENNDCFSLLANAVRPALQRREGRLDAILGLAPHADALIAALDIPPSAFRRDEDDGLFRLSLNGIKLPPLPERMCVRKAEDKDYELVVSWRVAFNVEAVHAQPSEKLEREVRAEISERIPNGELFLLEKDGDPVSLCGVHGNIPDTKMVGPVWTPADLRNRGYGRLAVGWALKQLYEQTPELEQAILFASRPEAVHVYESLGFTRFADWRLGMLKEDYRVKAAQ